MGVLPVAVVPPLVAECNFRSVPRERFLYLFQPLSFKGFLKFVFRWTILSVEGFDTESAEIIGKGKVGFLFLKVKKPIQYRDLLLSVHQNPRLILSFVEHLPDLLHFFLLVLVLSPQVL